MPILMVLGDKAVTGK